MTVVNPKSISGINSITTGSGSDNLLTIHTSDASSTERVRINSSGDVIVGSGVTVSPDGDIFATGVTTATTFVGALTGNVTGNISGGTVAGSTGTFSGAVSGTTGTFSGALSGTTGTFTGNVDIAANVRHIDDTDTYISFSADNQIEMYVANQQAIKFTTTSIETGDNKRIDIIDAAGDRSGEIKNSDSGANSLMISADPDGSGSSSVMQFAVDGSEKLRIDSSGNIMFGTTSSTVYDDTSGYGVVIRGATGALDVMRNNDHPLLLNRTGGDGQMCMYHRDGVNKAASALRSGHLCFDLPSGTEKIRFQSTGGISFNGDTATANALSDYEEGTFTLAASAMGVTNTDCKYIKIGRLVHCTGRIATGSSGNGSLVAQFSGLPFAGQTGTVNGGQGGTVPVHDVGVTLFTSLVSNSSMRMNNDTGSAYTQSTIDDKQMDFNITYYTT